LCLDAAITVCRWQSTTSISLHIVHVRQTCKPFSGLRWLMLQFQALLCSSQQQPTESYRVTYHSLFKCRSERWLQFIDRQVLQFSSNIVYKHPYQPCKSVPENTTNFIIIIPCLVSRHDTYLLHMQMHISFI